MDYYKSDDLLSASKLIAFSNHPKNYKFFSYGKADTKSLNIGNIVDCLLTEPDEFNNKYEVLDVDQSSKAYKFADCLVDIMFIKSDVITDEYIFKARKDSGYDGRLTDDKILDVYKTTIEPLYEKALEIRLKSKEVIDQATYDTCMKVVTSIQTNDFCQLEPDWKHEYQKVIYWEYEEMKCKSKLDILSINHETKEIKVRDIKTTGYGTTYFKTSFNKYKYYLQMAFYCLAVNYVYPDYTIISAEFIVESTVYPGTPLVYKMDKQVLVDSVMLIKKLVSDLMWHIQNDKWDYTKDVYESNGIIVLDTIEDRYN